jgi:hypothetical protein
MRQTLSDSCSTSGRAGREDGSSFVAMVWREGVVKEEERPLNAEKLVMYKSEFE